MACNKDACAYDMAKNYPCKDQYIFLLEFFVRIIKAPLVNKTNESYYIPTSVAFGFLQFERWWDFDLRIFPVDYLFKPQPQPPCDEEVYYSGKSALFALNHEQVMKIHGRQTRDNTERFMVAFYLLKFFPKPHSTMIAGSGEIHITAEFIRLREEMFAQMRKSDTEFTPISKGKQGTYKLRYIKQPNGTMTAYVRITALGQTVVTAIHRPLSSPEEGYYFSSENYLSHENKLHYKLRQLSEEHRFDREYIDQLAAEPWGEWDPVTDLNICNTPELPCTLCHKPEATLVPMKPASDCTLGGNKREFKDLQLIRPTPNAPPTTTCKNQEASTSKWLATSQVRQAMIGYRRERRWRGRSMNSSDIGSEIGGRVPIRRHFNEQSLH